MTIMRFCLFILLALVSAGIFEAAEEEKPPNVVIIIADDLGYGDLGCFGNTTLQTPHLDKLASQGLKLTHNIAADTMCSPSRAALLTGRYPIRSGMASSMFMRVIACTASASGLPANETTIGEVAKKAGYRTAFLGKWHQGWGVDRSDPEHHHPLNQGFDYFYGIPLTNIPEFDDPNDHILLHFKPHAPFQCITIFILTLITVWCLVRGGYLHLCIGLLLVLIVGLLCGGAVFFIFNMKLLNSFMFRNYDIVEQPVHLPSVTRKLVQESKEFLQVHHEDGTPFLLIMSWLHVHTAVVTAPQFKGHSRHGPYGDAVEEMDWGVGQLMDALDHYEMARDTFVYFTSDHGAPSRAKDTMGRIVGGSNQPFSGGKGDGSTEGSFRVPGIIRWPSHIGAGSVLREPVSLMDVLPTLADLMHVPLSSVISPGHVIDGISLIPLLTGQETVTPHQFLFHYCQDSVHAVRYRPHTGNAVWKLMLREPDPSHYDLSRLCDGALHLDPPKLFELTSDPTATVSLDTKQHSSVVSIMLNALKEHQQSVVSVPSQFALWRLLWQPWNQPCCEFPSCACEDKKFKGMFLN